MKSHYETLGIIPTVEPELIRSAYKTLAQLYHPDKHPGNDALMAEINAANDVLSDPEKRKVYDFLQESEINLEETITPEPVLQPEQIIVRKPTGFIVEELDEWNTIIDAVQIIISRSIIVGLFYFMFIIGKAIFYA